MQLADVALGHCELPPWLWGAPRAAQHRTNAPEVNTDANVPDTNSNAATDAPLPARSGSLGPPANCASLNGATHGVNSVV